MITAEEWDKPYTRNQATFPIVEQRTKFWPSVSRANDVYGDKNVVASIPKPGL